MTTNEAIRKILDVSVQAPSGGNSQPWHFKIDDKKIYIYADPEKDHPVLNFHHRGTWVAHGALIENIEIVAAESDYESSVDIFPNISEEPNLTAIITLRNNPDSRHNSDLFLAIPNRCSNRKTYVNKRLSHIHSKTLSRTALNFGPIECKFAEDPSVIVSLGKALAVSDQIMLENKTLHKLFFDEVVWTQAEERKKKEGIYLKTMELSTVQEFLFKQLKYWTVMNVLSHAGISKKIASENANIYSSASAIGAVLSPDSDARFIDVGRILQRIWLTATSLGLSFQVFAGVTFLEQSAKAGELSILSVNQIKQIREAYEKLHSVFETQDKLISLLFRVGYADAPTALSSKNDALISFLES